jgi:hypothetical protein
MDKFIHARIYAGKDDDLIVWLESLPAGDRSDAIREAMRVGIGLIPPRKPDLQAIAEVVKQAITEALSGIQITAAQQGVDLDTNPVEAEFGAKLDKLLNSF